MPVRHVDRLRRALVETGENKICVANGRLCSAQFSEQLRDLRGGAAPSHPFGTVRTIEIVKTPQGVADTASAHDWHTDGNLLLIPPRYFVLYFDRVDEIGGGISTFYPIRSLLSSLPWWVIEALATTQVKLARDTFRWTGTLLAIDRCGLNFRWRFDKDLRPEVVDARGTQGKQAIDYVKEIMTEKHPIEYAARRGDLIFVPNRLYLHGRSPLALESSRRLYRGWIE
ncbi:TauD/TfdA family dioxygenase [Bradyrhizobium sp.]